MDAGRALADELGDARHVRVELTVDADRSRLIDETTAGWDRLDVLVNNAGVSRLIPHDDLAAATPDVWHDLHHSTSWHRSGWSPPPSRSCATRGGRAAQER